jgi:DNA-binding beta-propeller fold protein YncE
MNIRALLTATSLVLASGTAYVAAQTVDLPTSKQLIGEIPGHPQRLNSLPMSMAVSPDGRYVVTVNAGYGTLESKNEQSLAVLDTQTGALEDFPDDRTGERPSRRSIPGWHSAATGSTCTRAWARSPRRRATARRRPGSGVVVTASRRERLRRSGLFRCRCSNWRRAARPS